MTIAKGQPILASDIIAVVDRVTAAETAITATNAAITATNTVVAGKQQNLPVGTILMYDGSGWQDDSTIPGWVQCDGAVKSVKKPDGSRLAVTPPNLRDYFIKGAGAAPASGGSNALTAALLPRHAHGLSSGGAASSGSHSHALSGEGVTASVVSGGAHGHSSVSASGSASGGSHGHDFYFSYSDHDAGQTSGKYLGGKNGEANFLHSSYDSTATASVATSSSHSHTVNVSGSATNAGSSHGHTLSGSTDSQGGHAHTLSGATDSDNSSVTDSNYNNMPLYYSVIYIRKCV